jgi:hypothetical protein
VGSSANGNEADLEFLVQPLRADDAGETNCGDGTSSGEAFDELTT